MADRIRNVLFLCTGNSARSLIAESLLNTEGKGRFRAWSAGSTPKTAPHPLTIDLLRRAGHDVSILRSKSWDELAGPDAPRMDLVVTVCEDAATEECPLWPGGPVTAHWGMPDPAAATGTDAERRRAFESAFRTLSYRISLLLSLPIDSLDPPALRRELGRMSGPRSSGPADAAKRGPCG
jgi:protein-tyrosine-phosphatase